MSNPEMGMKYDPYEKDIPHQGKQFEEEGKMVYWNMADAGDSVEDALNYNVDGRKPIDAREIDTPDGKKVITKWEVVEK